VPVSGSLVLNDMHLVLNAVLDGIGIGYLTEHVISPRVADGQLVPLLGIGATFFGSLLILSEPPSGARPVACIH
jgi:DNA-binding transcriptional LysR family regulator